MIRSLFLWIFFLSHMSLSLADEVIDVLLTNDDGYSSEGITVLHNMLVQAGYNVTVVAPLKQQSASGMKVSLYPLSVVKHSIDVWSVAGTPSDSVRVGLASILNKRPPQYVVSGPNFGQNLGSNVMLSGTVAAAVTGAMEGITSIALSVGLDLAESKAHPIKFPSTVAAFHDAAELLIRVLEEHQQQPALIPKGHVLNINYPLVLNVEGARYVSSLVSEVGGFKITHSEVNPLTNVSKMAISIEESERHLPDVDARYFSQGRVTLSLLKPDWNAANKDIKKLDQFVLNLNRGTLGK